MLPCLLNKTRCVFKKTSDGETPKQDTSLELLSLRGKWVTTTHLGKKGQNSLLSSSKFAKKKRGRNKSGEHIWLVQTYCNPCTISIIGQLRRDRKNTPRTKQITKPPRNKQTKTPSKTPQKNKNNSKKVKKMGNKGKNRKI